MQKHARRLPVLCAVVFAMIFLGSCGGQDAPPGVEATSGGGAVSGAMSDPRSSASSGDPLPTPTPAPTPLWVLDIGGADSALSPAPMTSFDFDALPQTSVEVEGAEYSGVLVMDILSHLQLPSGASYEFTGAAASVVLGTDQIITPGTMLANRKNGEAIAAPEGPLLLVVDGDFDLWLPGVIGLKPSAALP